MTRSGNFLNFTGQDRIRHHMFAQTGLVSLALSLSLARPGHVHVTPCPSLLNHYYFPIPRSYPSGHPLPHTCTQDGWFLQPERRPARLPGRTIFSRCIYVGVVECAPASPYTYSSSTHRFPDERTPIEATPLSATSAEIVLGVGLGLGLGSHSSSHAPLLLATLLSHNIPLPRVH